MAPVRSAISNGVAVLTIDNPPVNALGAAVRAGLAEALAAAVADASVKAIVIAAEGKVFVAGADISEFGKPPVPPALPDVLNLIETCAKPVVAAVNGMALGGGFELALSCHARVVAPKAKLGLPEIKLGIIPGAGGTQRLPRLIGAAPAFTMMASGDPIPADKALALGVADEVVEGDLVAAASARALALAEAGTWPKTSARAERFSDEDRAAFETAAAAAIKKAGRVPNVAALADAVRACLDQPFEAALAVERGRFLELVAHPSSKALRHIFFAEREAARIPGIGKDVKARPIAKAAVIGAGTMGGGIAMCFAQAGIPVTLIEVKAEALETGVARIRSNYEASVKRGSLSKEAMEQRLSLIIPAVGLENAADADIVVEAAFEDMGVKAEIFGALDTVTKPGTILATNTSYLDVDAIAAITTRPQDVVGLHFFSPANVMRLLEVVRGAKTAPDVLVTSLDLGRKLGKLPVVVGVCYGFVGNRMLAKRTQAAERLLLAGALPHEVDAAVTDFGFRMGPFAMADLAGIDIGWRARKATGGKAPVADALAEQGRFGQKTGRGFYLYPDGARTGTRDPETEALIVAMSEAAGITRRSFTTEEIQARLFYPMVNEGAKILEEGIAARSGDVDIIWVNGYNWPAFTGGPMHWAEEVGLAKIAAALEEFAAETGDESLKPAPLLTRCAAGTGTFAAPGARVMADQETARQETAEQGTPPEAPWKVHFPDVCDWDAPLEITTLPALLAAGVAVGGDGPALDFRGARISYAALAREVERLASGLAAAGVARGDNVALLLPNTPYHPLAFFALTRLGARVVHISALDAKREIIHKLKVTGARRLITTNLPGFLPHALDMIAEGVVDELLVGDDARWGAGEGAPLPMPTGPKVRALADIFCDAPLTAPLPEVGDIAVLQFTGGTTGLPKAAMLSHGNLTSAVSMYRAWRDGGRPLVAGTERAIAVLPLFHIYALTTVLLRHLRDGNAVLLRQRFDVETLVRDIAELKASQFSGVPTMWVALLNRPDADKVDFSSLKSCVSGGAPLPFDVQAKIEALIGTQLNNGWGMTETGPAGSRVPYKVARRPGLIGVPLPGLALRIVSSDEPGKVLPPGEVGEIAILGPNVFKGYLGDEAGTAAVFHDGWFLTGDLGRMDDQGLFEIVDRRKNMIISSGFNVYPTAVENAIYEHPGVQEVLVIGVPDAYRGQSAKAFIKLKAGAAPFTLEELTAFLADRLGRHEMPRALEFRQTLPRSPVGKLLHKELVAEEAARRETETKGAPPPAGPQAH